MNNNDKKEKRDRLDNLIEGLVLTIAAISGVFIMNFLTERYDILYIRTNNDFISYAIDAIIIGKILFHILINIYYMIQKKIDGMM